jgi:hypothetical protein
MKTINIHITNIQKNGWYREEILNAVHHQRKEKHTSNDKKKIPCETHTNIVDNDRYT